MKTMFDRLLKPKFYLKCKLCVKSIKTRLETIRKKRNAVQNFLKNDIAELLRNGLDYDYNAYGKAKGLLEEQNMLSCYELIDKFTGCISDHVEDLCKQKDCPDECKEAVQSLIYAAARFADLPELRELRTLLTEKYGYSLEPYISKEFVEKLRRDPPTKEMKIQLLNDIAQELSIEWDSKGLEQKLYKAPPSLAGRLKQDYLNDSDGEELHKNNDGAMPKMDNQITGSKQRGGRDSKTSKGDESDFLPQRRKDSSDDSWRLRGSSDDETSTDMSSQEGRKACSSSVDGVSGDEAENKRPFYYGLVPPPYLKSKANNTDSAALAEKESNYYHEPVVQVKPTPRSVRRRPLNAPRAHEVVSNSNFDEAEKVDARGMKSQVASQSKGKAYTKDLSFEQPEYNAGANRRLRKSDSAIGSSVSPELATSINASKGLRGGASLDSEVPKADMHVHPKLPDYDDLSALLAALRGR